MLRTSMNKTEFGVFLSAFIMNLVSIGLGYGFSVMYAEIISVFNTTRFVASLIQGIYLSMTMIGGMLWSCIVQRYGTGPTSVCGILLASTGLFFCCFATHIGVIIVLAGLLCGFGMSVCYLSAYIWINETFKEDPRFFLTCLTVGTSLGQMIGALIFEILIANYFWSGAFLILSGLVLQCLPFALFMCLYSRRADRGALEEMPGPTILDVTILNDFFLCVILVNAHLIILTGNVEAFFIVDQLLAFHIPRAKGSAIVSAIGGATLLGRITACILIYLCKKWPTIYHWLYVGIVMAAGHFLVLQCQTFYNLLVLACVLQGVSFGIMFSQCPTVIYEAVGGEKYPAAMALANIFIGLGDILCCSLGGLIRDGMGTYDMVYYVATGASLYIAVSSLLVVYKIRQNKQRKESELISRISSQQCYATLN